MRPHKLLALPVLFLSLALAAQTYTPKQIRLQGAGELDQGELMRVLALKPGVPLSKADIESGVQRLADTGSFTDLSYTVDGQTLTIILKAAEGSQALPVRFSNFAWWKPGELEPLLRARVPLFQGKLPLTGELTNQVMAALVTLLGEKGVPNAKVTAGLSTLEAGGKGIGAIVLSITSPRIILGEMKLVGGGALVQGQLDVVSSKLAGQEFDSLETPTAIVNNVVDTHLNGGYLDARVDPPVFELPHTDMLSYAIDGTATVHTGELYRIAALELSATAPLSQLDAEKALGLRVGDAAGTMNLRIAEGSLTRAYALQGHLEAHVQAFSSRNAAAHTVTDRFSIAPGELDHLAAVDTSALSPELQAEFAKEWQGKAGMAAGIPLNTELVRTLRAIGATSSVRLSQRVDRRDHTVTLILTPGPR